MSSLSASEFPAIRVENLSVVYRRAVDRRPTVRKTVRRLRHGQDTTRKVEALKDVSFEVSHGTSLGVVGSNGAGKSTLMRVIGGILPPTEGRVVTTGHVSTLLSLGVGFNKKLSGRDNVMLGGLAAGLTREQMEEKYEQIVDFANLKDFMDEPTRTYSSGMYGRLAFSVAANMDPDILLIDEALSTGDGRFRKKSARKMRQLVKQERTVILVSHAMNAIKNLCDRAIWLESGVLQMEGDPQEVVAAYEEFLEVGDDALLVDDI